MLASQNITPEYYRKEFNKLEPVPELSFSDLVSSVTSTLDRWLRLSHVYDYKGLCFLTVKNKIRSSCNTNLVSFLIERDPQNFADLTRIGEKYFAVYPNIRVQKYIPVQAFACEGGLEIADMLHNPYRVINHSLKVERGNDGVFAQGRSYSEHIASTTPFPPESPAQPDRRFRDPSTPRSGCRKCGSFKHVFHCSHKSDIGDHDSRRGGYKQATVKGCLMCNDPHLQRNRRKIREAHAAETYSEI